jgi:Rrf2 family protein
MISQKAKYALRALIALARAQDSLMIADIAQQHSIPRKFLEQILLEMKHHGIVVSRRGRLGGYALLRPADQITFGQVLRLIDGPIAPLPCLSRTAYRRCSDCRSERDCEVRRVFSMRPRLPTRWPAASHVPLSEARAARVPRRACRPERRFFSNSGDFLGGRSRIGSAKAEFCACNTILSR